MTAVMSYIREGKELLLLLPKGECVRCFVSRLADNGSIQHICAGLRGLTLPQMRLLKQQHNGLFLPQDCATLILLADDVGNQAGVICVEHDDDRGGLDEYPYKLDNPHVFRAADGHQVVYLAA